MSAATSPPPDTVYFWRETEQPYGFLSQWYESPFDVDGVKYNTAEMWMMIQKAKLFGDEDIAQQMMQTTSPRKHQALGRQARGFDAAKWNDNKSRIVEEGTYHKFTKGEHAARLRKMLLETGDRRIVEASPKDSVWGIGFAASDANQNREWWGENRLGEALMKMRTRLQEEAKERENGAVD